MVFSPSIPLPYSVGPIIYSMLDDMENSHRICKYLKCIPKSLSTWVYISTIIKLSLPPLYLSLFLHMLLAPITKVYNTLFSTSVVGPPLRNLHKLMPSPMSTPAGINTSTSACNSLNPSWKPSSKSWITRLFPPFLWKPNPQIVHLVPLTPITISPPNSSLQLTTLWCPLMAACATFIQSNHWTAPLQSPWYASSPSYFSFPPRIEAFLSAKTGRLSLPENLHRSL